MLTNISPDNLWFVLEIHRCDHKGPETPHTITFRGLIQWLNGWRWFLSKRWALIRCITMLRYQYIHIMIVFIYIYIYLSIEYGIYIYISNIVYIYIHISFQNPKIPETCLTMFEG